MSVPLRELLSYLDTELRSAAFRDYAPNGLQVEGRAEVARVITGVSASAALLEAAIERKAELVIVHHGLIWGGGIARVEGPMAQRLKLLLANELSLAAYHLPLDAHARLGNNAGLADAIGLAAEERSWFGDVRGHALGLAAGWASDVGDVRDDGSLSLDEALARIGAGVCAGAAPRFVFPFGPRRVRKVGLCTGAASDLLEDAARAGCDLFVTGELAERAGDLARELQITLVAAGHYATEIFGPMRIADEVCARFPSVTAEFLPMPSPL
jgi:dinuclear metal center YbgI/SA1388 family protein